MLVAFDDTDSESGMCTTYLATEIIRRTSLDLIGHPMLVRLNPNISYKTRGNGAVVLRLARGKGQAKQIGRIGGKPILSYSDYYESGDVTDAIETVAQVISEYAVLSDNRTNPGAAASSSGTGEQLYWEALRREVGMKEAEEALEKAGSQVRKFKLGRGIIGCAAAMGWRGRRKTYELLSYSYPRSPEVEKAKQLEVAAEIDRLYPDTFSNVDHENSHASIFPVNRTPVIYGVRSVSPEALPEVERTISVKFGISGERSIVFETNQGTDDHIVRDPIDVRELGSYSIEGEIWSIPGAMRGGHYFSNMKWNGGLLKLAAFEPTKGFRRIFRELRPGDRVRVAGSVSGETLKVEKMEVISTSRFFTRGVPACKACGAGMRNNGVNDYRCPICGSRARMADYSEEQRDLLPGKYEVPVSARRHLAMPLKLEGHFSIAGENQAAGAAA